LRTILPCGPERIAADAWVTREPLAHFAPAGSLAREPTCEDVLGGCQPRVRGLAQLRPALRAPFDQKVPLVAYELRLTEKNQLEWTEPTSQEEKAYNTEPGTSALRRVGVGFLSILPMERML